MLDPKGNTAIYLIYAYVRMCSIIRKSGLNVIAADDLKDGADKIVKAVRG